MAVSTLSRLGPRLAPLAGNPLPCQGNFPSSKFVAACSSVYELLMYGARSLSSAASQEFETVKVSVQERVALLTLSRPKALNALNSQVMNELTEAVERLEADSGVGVIVITGEGQKAFAAGADIKEMAPKQYSEVYDCAMLGGWDKLTTVRKPLIAAVNGYALGGGCELAMACDIIIASENASFGQPEVMLGVIPGMGGTQRLVRAIGKSRAMEMVLTGNRIGAAEAERLGLVSRVVAPDSLLSEALTLAKQISGFSAPVVAKAKDTMNRAFETSLSEGLRYEKREFWSCWALEDQKEGMKAFVEKRSPTFKHK